MAMDSADYDAVKAILVGRVVSFKCIDCGVIHTGEAVSTEGFHGVSGLDISFYSDQGKERRCYISSGIELDQALASIGIGVTVND